jgi:hypothetical protein
MSHVTMTARMLVIAGLAVALAEPVRAQTPAPPDLSGTWIFNPSRSKIAKHADTSVETLVISASGETIQFHYSSSGKDHTEKFIVDGKEHAFARFQGGEDVQKASWKKATLVIEVVGRVHGPDPNSLGDFEAFHTTDRWTLSPDGHSLINKSSGGLGDTPDTTLVYDKQ